MEEWREYNDTGYFVSNMGNVMNKHGKILKLTLTPKNYYRVGIKSRLELVHKLVANCFIGEKPPGLQIDHINRIRTDNRVENLRYVSQSENMKNASSYRNDILEQDPIIRLKIMKIEQYIKNGRLKKPREYYINRLYDRLNRQEL